MCDGRAQCVQSRSRWQLLVLGPLDAGWLIACCKARRIAASLPTMPKRRPSCGRSRRAVRYWLKVGITRKLRQDELEKSKAFFRAADAMRPK
jgi:hypothetical protein